jgi:hypothetical protein
VKVTSTAFVRRNAVWTTATNRMAMESRCHLLRNWLDDLKWSLRSMMYLLATEGPAGALIIGGGILLLSGFIWAVAQ